MRISMEAAAPIQVEEQGVMPLRGHIAVLVLRQLCGALLGLAIASLLRTFCGVTDRVLLMTLLLQSCGPPMINLSVMAGVSGSVQKDSAKLLLITYAASVVTWVLWTMIFLSWEYVVQGQYDRLAEQADFAPKLGLPSCALAADELTLALYGVFDGHGQAGHHCAAFARGVLPESLFGQGSLIAGPEEALRVAFAQVQEQR
eukprot:g18191.t1